MLICASLCNGVSSIDNVLDSQDVHLTIGCLRNMGAAINLSGINSYTITGFAGRPKPHAGKIYLGNSGTSMRLLSGIAALGNTEYVLTGDERMKERPMIELLDALKMIQVHAGSFSENGTPPVFIDGSNCSGGNLMIDCSRSSQYLSALLMAGPVMKKGIDIELISDPVSSPYINLTIDIMKKFNVEIQKKDGRHYYVKGEQTYIPADLFVEPDLSNAGYFWAIGAVTGNMISVRNINIHSLQGDIKQVDIFKRMGCRVEIKNDSIGVKGEGILKGIHEIDMSDTPDAVPAVAVAAGFAKGPTRIVNIGHLREKECDRIDAVASQLSKMNIRTEQGPDFIIIKGGRPRGAVIETFNDHRIAMAFSIPGLVIPGIEIENEHCVGKSFPDYWDIFESL